MSRSRTSQSRRVVDYFMSLHYGVCMGPVDEVLSVSAKEKKIWTTSTDENGTFAIVKPYIFGGDEKEGGCVGLMDVYMGAEDQRLSEDVAKRLVDQSEPGLKATLDSFVSVKGSYSEAIPGHRGYLSLFFRGVEEDVYLQELVDEGDTSGMSEEVAPLVGTMYGGDSEVKFAAKAGFMWTQNSPFTPPVEVKVRRAPVGLNASIATIETNGVKDANPVHMIYECYTNKQWGLGRPASMFDDTWNDVALEIFNEGFGLSMMWTRQVEVEKFVQEIVDHIQAIVQERPDTGQLSIKLIRGGYDTTDLFEFNPGNCTIVDAERMSLENTVNEMVVTWTNPLNEEEETVSAHDIGNIAAQNGNVNSDSRNYYGVRNAELATKLANRDLRPAAYPLFACKIVTDRNAASIEVGEVVKLSWPKRQIASMLVRVGEINRGKPGSGKVVLTVTEDIFGLESAEYQAPPKSGWTNPVTSVVDMPYQTVISVPYALLPSPQIEAEYPEVWAGFLGQSGSKGVQTFTVTTEVEEADGSLSRESAPGYVETPVLLLATALPQEVETKMTRAELGTFFGANGYVVGAYLLVGDTEETGELIQIVDYDSVSGEWTLMRGVLDTTPKAWPIGEPVWSLEEVFDSFESTASFPGEARKFWFRPRTSDDILAVADATEINYTPNDRMHRPHRNADLTLDSNHGWDPLIIPEGSTQTHISLGWATRNRQTEDAIPIAFDGPSTAPEPGQTTTVRVTDATDTVTFEETGLTGDTYSLSIASFSTGTSPYRVAAVAVLDGLESFQNHERTIDILVSGYGNAYGQDYGSP